jgi:hypothetical protein
MLKRFSVPNLDQDAIAMLPDIKAEERRELGAILEDCISAYWHELFEDDPEVSDR